MKKETRKIKEVEEDEELIIIFDGELIQINKDNEFFYLITPYAILTLPLEVWESFKKDIQNLGDI